MRPGAIFATPCYCLLGKNNNSETQKCRHARRNGKGAREREKRKRANITKVTVYHKLVRLSCSGSCPSGRLVEKKQARYDKRVYRGVEHIYYMS
jgi:hypothetical protein